MPAMPSSGRSTLPSRGRTAANASTTPAATTIPPSSAPAAAGAPPGRATSRAANAATIVRSSSPRRAWPRPARRRSPSPAASTSLTAISPAHRGQREAAAGAAPPAPRPRPRRLPARPRSARRGAAPVRERVLLGGGRARRPCDRRRAARRRGRSRSRPRRAARSRSCPRRDALDDVWSPSGPISASTQTKRRAAVGGAPSSRQQVAHAACVVQAGPAVAGAVHAGLAAEGVDLEPRVVGQHRHAGRRLHARLAGLDQGVGLERRAVLLRGIPPVQRLDAVPPAGGRARAPCRRSSWRARSRPAAQARSCSRGSP